MEETLSIILILSTGFVLFLGILGVVIWFWIGAVLPSIEYAIEEFKENRGRKKGWSGSKRDNDLEFINKIGGVDENQKRKT